MVKYPNQLKQVICEAVCEHHESTIDTATHYNVPLKTVEKWVTAYNKDPRYFKDRPDFVPAVPAASAAHATPATSAMPAAPGTSTASAMSAVSLKFTPKAKREEKALKKYGEMSNEELRMELLARDVELARLKKGYVVRESGGKLEYGTFLN